MSDDVAGSVLAVLMYSGAFHDLLKGCGEGGVCSTTALNLHRSKSSVKTDNWVIWYQRSSLFKTMEEEGAVDLRGFKDLLALSSQTQTHTLLQIVSTYFPKMFSFGMERLELLYTYKVLKITDKRSKRK